MNGTRLARPSGGHPSRAGHSARVAGADVASACGHTDHAQPGLVYGILSEEEASFHLEPALGSGADNIYNPSGVTLVS